MRFRLKWRALGESARGLSEWAPGVHPFGPDHGVVGKLSRMKESGQSLPGNRAVPLRVFQVVPARHSGPQGSRRNKSAFSRAAIFVDIEAHLAEP